MTELSFLVSLLLDHKLPKATQKAVKDRISDVERGISAAPAPVYAQQQQPASSTARPFTVRTTPPAAGEQAESTKRMLERHPDIAAAIANGHPVPQAPPQPQAPIDPTPAPQNPGAIAQALAARQNLINKAMSGPQRGDIAAPKAHGAPKG